MANISILLLSIVPVLLILLAGLIVLQIFLAKRPNRLVGFILPLVSFAFAVLLTFITPHILSAEFFIPIVFILANVPTVIFIIIYFICYKRINKISEIKKMSIQDLE